MSTFIPHESITIPPNRQRAKVDNLSHLMDSIRRIGLLHPIVITKENILVAGERRLQAWRQLDTEAKVLGMTKYHQIPVNYRESLDPMELQIVELDENIRRQDITWLEQANAIFSMHEILKAENPVWTYQATADRIGLHASVVSDAIGVINESKVSGERVLSAPTLRSAIQIVRRNKDRRQQNTENAISDLLKTNMQSLVDAPLVEEGEEPELPLNASAQALPEIAPAQPASDSIFITDCIKFMATYSGERFNLLHCDFPYGIGFDTGWDNNAEQWGSYKDDPETYWKLLKALAQFWDNIILPSSHFIFWFSMHHYSETMRFLNEKIPQLTVEPFPLIWHKTDNRGTLPDPNRGPRRIYETALYGYTGDRKIVKAVSNTYGAPTNKSDAIHISEKPEPVLRHFFSMLVDENTSLFDPTCGSGTSLRAAESLKARRVIGTELNEEYATAARKRLDAFRALNKIGGK